MSFKSYKTGVTVTSTTLADLGGVVTGHIRQEDGKKYILAKAGGTIPDGYAASPDISLTAAAEELVFVTTSATAGTSTVWCINNTGGSIASGTYFWGLVEGIGYGYVDTAGTVTAGIVVSVEGTAGELMETTDSVPCGVALDTIAADATGAMFFYCNPSGHVTAALVA
jgi:hypothetical protein